MEKITTLEYNVLTGKTITREVELTEEEVAFRQKDARLSEIREQMISILARLQESDWKTIKYIEGSLSKEDFDIHTAYKAQLRLEYNILESEQNALLNS